MFVQDKGDTLIQGCHRVRAVTLVRSVVEKRCYCLRSFIEPLVSDPGMSLGQGCHRVKSFTHSGLSFIQVCDSVKGVIQSGFSYCQGFPSVRCFILLRISFCQGCHQECHLAGCHSTGCHSVRGCLKIKCMTTSHSHFRVPHS
jgi:hypothetical protein